MSNQFHPLNDDGNASPAGRSIDDFLEDAYRHNSSLRRDCRGMLADVLQHWRYYVIFLALGLANSGDSAELGLTNYILSSSAFQRDILLKDGEDGDEDEIDFAGRGAAIAGSHFAGMLISGLLSGVLADVVGRRRTLLLGLGCNSVVGMLCAAARTAAELCALRFMLGIGLGMVIAGVVTLCAEVSPPSKRGRFMTLVSSCYTLGFLYTSFWALMIFQVSGSGNWRLFCFLNALPSLVSASLVVLFAPESPRYFLTRGRTKEAAIVCNTIALRIGYVDSMLTEEELMNYLSHAKRVGDDTIKSNETAIEGTLLLKEFGRSLVGIKQVFMKGMYRSTVPLQFSYFCLTLVTGVFQWVTKIFQMLELQTDAYLLSFINTLAQIPGMMIASGLIDYTGRRQLVIAGFGGGSATLIFLSAIANWIKQSHEETSGEYYSFLILGLMSVYSIFLCVAWLSLDCLSAESFPTRVRSTGRGVCVATGRIAGFCVQFLYGPLISRNELGYMLGLASIFGLFGVAVSCKTTDTTKVDLRDHWDGGEDGAHNNNGSHDRQPMRITLAETKRMD